MKNLMLIMLFAAVLFPTNIEAREVRDPSGCLKVNVGLFSFTTGKVQVDVYDDVTGDHISSYKESCGGFNWFWQ